MVQVKILIVDHEVEARATLFGILGEEGYGVTIAQTGTEALKEVQRRVFDIAIIDAKLPDIGGMGMLRVMKGINPRMEVIMAAAHSTIGISIGAIDEGAYGYVAKPFNAGEVKMIIRKALEKQKIDGEKSELTEHLRDVDKKLRETQERLIRSERLAMIGQVATNISHEIFNPLTTISGWVQLLLSETEEKSPRRGHLKNIEKEIKRITKLAQGLLSYSRRASSFKKPLNINGLIDETLALTEEQTMAQGVKIVKELSSGLPLISADSDQLQQVLINLISNALDAMPHGGELKISTRIHAPHPSKGAGVEVRVQDTGYGIPEKEIGRIFEPFFTVKKGKRATGLGLAIAYEIVKGHRGSLTAESIPGKGTTFIIQLPIKPGKE